MTKKRILIFSAFIIGILVLFNIYIYNSNNNVNNQINECNLNTQSLACMSNIKIDINKVAQAQKLYLLTSKSDYKSEYEFYFKKIYNEVNELYKDGIINKTQYINLKNSLDDYKTLNDNLISNNSENISLELENVLLSSNDAQIKFLSKLDDIINTTKDTITEQNATIKDNTDLQINVAQVTSTIITSIITLFVYLIKKYSKSDTLDDVFKCLIGVDNNKEDESDFNNKYKNDINSINETLKQYEQIIEIANILSKQNSKLECNLSKCKILINDIKKSINILCNDSHIDNKYAQAIIADVQDQLIELSILFESLPIYNDLLLDLYELIKAKEK